MRVGLAQLGTAAVLASLLSLSVPAGAANAAASAPPMSLAQQKSNDDCPAGQHEDSGGDCVGDDSGTYNSPQEMIPVGGVCPAGLALYEEFECLCMQYQSPGLGSCAPCSEVGRHEVCR